MSKILGVPVDNRTRGEVVSIITKHLENHSFLDIVSLNPETLVIAQSNHKYKDILSKAGLKLVDGVGVSLAGKILGILVGERVTGVDLMQELIRLSDELKLKVLILGGNGTVAQDLSEKVSKKYRDAEFKGIQGYLNTTSPSTKEEREVQAVLKDYNPDLVFVAYGAPQQEFWVEEHKQFLSHTVCMVVGGAVDFLAGKVPRAPVLLQKIGLEWLFRLIVQPWRWRRQLKLFTFLGLVLKQRLAHL